MDRLDIEGTKVDCRPASITAVLLDNGSPKYPFIVSGVPSATRLTVPSPLHGRSLVVGHDSVADRYIVTKGNGLTYFPFGFVDTEELEGHAWGLLGKEDAIRDFKGGDFVSGLGILTNAMESVYALEEMPIRYRDEVRNIQPHILQYSVKCPYRIADLPFLSKSTIDRFVGQWHGLVEGEHKALHCIAAEVLLGNVRAMHESHVLHNAIHVQNYSLSLELLDFESSRTPVTPYGSPEDETSYAKLMKREVIQSLEVVGHIAFHLKEHVNAKALGRIMEKFGYGGYRR